MTHIRGQQVGGGDMLVATYDPAAKATQLLATSDIVTTVGSPGSDTVIPSEQGVREALNVIDQKKLKTTFFATITSGTTSGTVTKPAGAGADVDFIMDEWGTVTDALVSTIENGKPTFKSPVDAGGNTITTTFDAAGAFAFSATPSPAADHALIYVYTCYLKNFNVAEALWETEFLDYVADHADTHTDGSDDIQSATNAQKGLATAAQITQFEANTKRYIYIRLLDKDTSHTVADGIGGDFRLKVAMTVLDVGCYFDTPGTGSVTTLEIFETGTTILTDDITVDATEKTSETAATPPSISDSAIAANAILTFNLSGIASGTAGKGLVVWLEVTIP